MIERRISAHRWNELTEEDQDLIKQLSKQFAQDNSFDYEYSYYWVRFEPANWLLAVLKNPRIEILIT